MVDGVATKLLVKVIHTCMLNACLCVTRKDSQRCYDEVHINRNRLVAQKYEKYKYIQLF